MIWLNGNQFAVEPAGFLVLFWKPVAKNDHCQNKSTKKRQLPISHSHSLLPIQQTI